MASNTTSRRARRSRLKGSEGEREVVQLHRAMGIHAERVPLSGAMAYRGNGENVDVYAFGRDEGPLAPQVKRQATDAGWREFRTAETREWQGFGALTLRYREAVPWRATRSAPMV